eukprot:348533_1
MATQAPADGAFWLDKKSLIPNNQMRARSDSSSSSNSSNQSSLTRRQSNDIMKAVAETGTANHETAKLRSRTKVIDGILRFQTNSNAQIVYSHINQNDVAKIFTGTEKLGPDAILE